jgi:hypothetical protein
MDSKSNKPPGEDHDQPPQDEATRKKIDKHLSDESDTISEDDMKNINTSTGTDTDALAKEHLYDKDEADEIMKEKPDDDEPEEEAPTPWNILGS